MTKPFWIPIACTLVVGAAIGSNIPRWLGADKPVPLVLVDPIRLEKNRIPAKPSIGTRLTSSATPASQVRRGTAPSAEGKKRVAEYCAPVRDIQIATASAPSSDSVNAIAPAVLPDFQGRIRGRNVTLISTLSGGTPYEADYRARGHWQIRTTGDHVDVRSERLLSRLARGAGRCAIVGAAGTLFTTLAQDKPLPGLIGGVTSCAISLF